MQIIRCGQLWDGTGDSLRAEQRIVVGDDGRIVAVEADRGGVPSGAKVVDLRGLTVIPGLVDAHDHLGIDMDKEESYAHEHDAATVVRCLYNARVLVSGGYTTMRNLGEKNFIDGYVAEALNKGQFPGPRVIRCGKFICRTGGHGWQSGHEINGPDDARRAVREQLRDGADFIKCMLTGGVSTKGSSPLTQELSDEEIKVIVEEAHRAGRKVAAHCYGGPGARVGVEAGIDSVEHGALLSREDLALMAKKGTYLVITYGIMQTAAGNPKVPEYWQDKLKQVLASYGNVIRWAKELGVKVATGGDESHGRPDLELLAMVEYGWTPAEALRAMCSGGAELLGLGDRTGTLTPGKAADLVAVEGNPLDDVGHVRSVRLVMRDGVEQYPGFYR